MGQTFELNDELINSVLATALGEDSARVLSFNTKALKAGAGNLTSLGVYRVWGTATTASGEAPFSVVVKHLADGNPAIDFSEPQNWNYWLREIVFFESSLVAKIPAALGYPLYLGSSNLPDGTALFWNEDLGDLEDNNWSWAKCLQAAELVAELNSIKIDEAEQFVWFNTTQMQTWHDFMPWWPQRHAAVVERARLEKNAALTKVFELIAPFIENRELIMQLVASTPRVFAHGDFNLNNLVTRDDGSNRIIALDWQLCGLAPVATEVAAIFNTAHELAVVEATLEQFNEICAVYFETFKRISPQTTVTLDDVKRVAAAMGIFILGGMGYYYLSPDGELRWPESEKPIDEFLARAVAGPLLTYAKVLKDLI